MAREVQRAVRAVRAMLLLYGLPCLLFAQGKFTSGQLVRPRYVYEGLIKGVHDYFNNTCIILLHATPNPMETQGLEEADGLLALQRYLSALLKIRTSIMDFKMFRERVGQSYYRIKRPLFVVLNDHEDVRKEFMHVSNNIEMSYPTWLFFLRDETKPSDFFEDIYVPFDCKLLISQRNPKTGVETIREVYRIDREGELRSMNFGSWNEKHGMRGPRRGLYQRRNDLHGHNLRVTSIHDPPISLIKRNHRNEIIGLGGFFGEVMDLLREGMNCTITYKEADSWGIRLPDGTWKGSIGMLMNGEADLAAIELMMTSDRLDVVQFTTPIYVTKCRTYIKRPDSMAVKWDAYTSPFAPSIWSSIGLLAIVAGGTVVLIKLSVEKLSPPSELTDYEHSPSRFLEVLFYMLGALCGQGMESSMLDPVRLVQLIVHLAGFVILAAYSAALISFLAVKTFVLPFTTMEGLLADGTYRFAVTANSADYTFFQNTTDKVLSVMFEELLERETDLPVNYLDGLRRVCREHKYSFMTMDNMAAVLQDDVECTLVPLDVMMQSTIAMAVPRSSPYRGIVNSNILLLRDSGILQRLLKAQWSYEIRRPTTWTSVQLEDVLPLLIFMALAVFVSFFVFLSERAVYRKLAERQRRAAGRESVQRFR